MDFGIKGSDCWESDAFQDKFIKDYFGTSSSGKKFDSPPEGKKSKSKRKRSKSGDKNDLVAEIEPQENSFTEMVAKPKKSKKKKNKSAIKSGEIAEVDTQEHLSVETIAKPKKRKREKIAYDDIAEMNKQEYSLTKTVVTSKKKKRTKSVDKSDDISMISPHEHSIAETVTKPKKNKKKKHKNDAVTATDVEGSSTIEAVVRSKKKKKKRSKNDASAAADVQGSVTTETLVKPKEKSENNTIAAKNFQGSSTTEMVAKSKKKKKIKSTNESNAKIDIKEHSSTETIAKPNKKRKNHPFDVQLMNSSKNSKCEKTANSSSSLSHSIENPKFQTKSKKKTRRGKRVPKSKIEACEQVSSSTNLLEQQENTKDKYLQNKLEYFKNKFKALKGKAQNDSSMAEDFSSVKKPKKAQFSSSEPRFSRLNDMKEKTHDDSSWTEDFSSVRKQKKAQLLPSLPRSVRSSALKEKAQKVLRAAKFRIVNEKLYSGSGKEAMNYFKVNKEAFKEYHEGYELQVSKWPVNPVDLVISHLKGMPNDHIIADLGCGNAKIATTFPLRTVYSYDLVPTNEHVTQCDISKVPLGNDAVDIAVFCLSLMGTNLNEYILEAHRILKTGGLLKIAEVESRIDDLNEFIKSIEAYGFQLSRKDISHKMFVLLDFNKIKVKLKRDKLPPIVLSPCLYKKR